jgi:hypothetical protein
LNFQPSIFRACADAWGTPGISVPKRQILQLGNSTARKLRAQVTAPGVLPSNKAKNCQARHPGRAQGAPDDRLQPDFAGGEFFLYDTKLL